MVGECRLVKALDQCDRIQYTHRSATTAWTPIFTDTFGVLIPITSKDANVENSYYRGGQFNFDIADSVTVNKGDPVFYNSSTGKVVVVDPTTSGFFIGQAVTAGSAAGGYVDVEITRGGKTLGVVSNVSYPSVLIADGAKLLHAFCTCADTDASNSLEPVRIETTMTGAGQVGGRVRFALTINAAAGGWSNALKSDVTYGASGKTAGLGSAHCMEMTLSAGCTDGNYAPCEIELNVPTGAATGTATAFQYLSMQGDGVATARAAAHLFSLNGVGSATAGSLFDTCVATPASHALRILIDGTPYYIMLTNNVDDN